MKGQCLFIAMLLLFSHPGSLKAQQQERSVKIGDKEVRYLVYLPEGYRESGKEWPLLVFLHGSGERGTDMELVKKHGPPKLIEQGVDFEFIVVSPQCPFNERWSAEQLAGLIEHVYRQFWVDARRICLTGLSMGGSGTWDLAMAYPEKFAAIAPVCGVADTSGACLVKDLPAWVFHGAKDNVIPPERSEEIVAALKECGGKVKLTIYPDADHDSWTQTYENPKLYRWLFRHHR